MFYDEVALRVSDLGKQYQIYKTPSDRLKQFLVPKFLKIIGSKKDRNYFQEFWALRNISFEVKKGQTVGIIGKNGSGKSTLLQLICGTLNPTNGVVQVNGRVAALLELGSGFNPEFTGKENIYLNATVLGLSEAEIDMRYQDILDFADIGEFVECPVKTYSSGMMLRLAFAVIAHVDADILVIDEALSVGDAFFTQKCMRFLHQFMKTKTILFVSHDAGAVLNLCDYVYQLENGLLVLSGPPKVVINRYLNSLYAGTLTHDPSPAETENYPEKNDLPSNPSASNESEFNPFLQMYSEVFKFDSRNVGMGTKKVRINSVSLLNQLGLIISTILKQQEVTLRIEGEAFIDLNNPIVGFELKDRLGQVIFADNTYLAFINKQPKIEAGSRFCAEFCFVFPVLLAGEYSFSVAVADGTQENHKQHHWIFDCLIVRVHSSSTCFGLVGIPMSKINLLTI
ncbi:ABC transporter ATP-binding protein [Polynucleobacter paneuropaeus]|nr:ABC transporter ATP-binding protein [Polynucleobacter paneuropaeus]